MLILFLLSLIANIYAQYTELVHRTETAEKIYIHFDRPYYSAGETIWYKIYLFHSGFPSLLSSEFFLQLEDESGNVIEKKRYPVTGATVTGSLTLNEVIPQGYYKIRAVTKSIAANDIGSAYSKNLFIFNPSEKKSALPLRKNISLQFFPESGRLTDRIKSQLAFKATDETGMPVGVTGVIKSESGAVITSFKTFHDGIGRLSFTPHINDIFFAELDLEGKVYKFPLPDVQASGIYLKITDADSGKIFEITRSKKDKDLFDTVRLIVRMNNDTVFENLVSFGYEQSVSELLQTVKIPSGIIHFIVLSKYGVPLAERLSFVNNREYISPAELVVVKRDSSKRGANTFEFNFPDTAQRSFSISVTDHALQQFSDKDNIYSGLLLTADLKGYIYNPSFYFEKDDPSTKLALDNLMLTHGWTRYNAREETISAVAKGKEADHYLLTIAGSVLETNNRQPVSGGNLALQLIAEDSSILSFTTTVEKNGNFKLDSLLFFGEARIYYSYTAVSGRVVKVDLRLNYDTTVDLFRNKENGYDQKTAEERESFISSAPVTLSAVSSFESKFKKLAPVFLQTTFKRPLDILNDKYASSIFRSSGKIVLDNISNPYYGKTQSVIEYILMNIRTVDIYRDEGILVNKKNFSLSTQRNWKVELFVDENISTVANSTSINMDMVAMIKFYEAGFIGVGSQAPGGAVAVYLKKNEEDQPKKIREKFLTRNGYSVTQEFYHPDYKITSPASVVSDNRPTLYWNTGLKTGATSNKINFSFYNNDFSKRLSIVIEGFDARGRLFHYEKDGGE
ncbi:MAG: hypothetical protein H7258_11000 [Ferruginibacter sp.]|nr:hypothetical protein [Ferruginibacter sp.]